MATEFTIDDVNAWLACSREAGKKVWMDSNFYQAMAFKSIEIFPSYFNDVEKKNMHIQLHQSNFDLLQESYFAVFELQDNMKRKHKEESKVYSFIERSQFISYVKISVSGTLATAVTKHLMTSSKVKFTLDYAERLLSSVDETGIEDIIDIKNDMDCETGNLPSHESAERQQSEFFGQSGDIEEEIDYDSDPQYAAARRLCRESGETLLVSFEEYQGLTPAMKRFLSLFLECSENLKLGMLGVIAMLENRYEHLSFLEEMRERQGDAFNQNTYNSYVIRLEVFWREFLESEEGKRRHEEFVRRYKACFH